MIQGFIRLKVVALILILLLLSGCVLPEEMANSGSMSGDSPTGDLSNESVAMTRVLTQDVQTHASRGDVQTVAGAGAQLVHTDDGVMMTFETAELTPGNVYTAWWVFINNIPAAWRAIERMDRQRF